MCGGSVFYAKRGRGGNDVSAKITCGKKEKGWFGKSSRDRKERKRKERRVIMVGWAVT